MCSQSKLYKIVYLDYNGEQHAMIVGADSPAMARHNAEALAERDKFSIDHFESTTMVGDYFIVTG